MAISYVLGIWDVLVVCSINLSASLVIYQAFFDATVTWQWALIYTVDMLFLIEIVLRFCRGYQNFRGETIKHKEFVILHYLRTLFFPDLVSTIPFESIALLAGVDDMLYFVAMLRLNRLLRLYRVWKFLCKQTDRNFSTAEQNDYNLL